ncbi:MAG: hypothetical protein JSW53_00900 [Candidatus Bathyarchaeota archaeon]|nr:MAG: hypothetical protein JSW53_00900 [Candidatus Bathyarchaeota archaeon]
MLKQWVVAGVVVLAVGLFVTFVPYVETFRQNSVVTSIGIGDHYTFEPFSAGKYDWLDLDILASDDVNVFVKGQIVKTIFNLRGRLFQYRVGFDEYDAYWVEIHNPEYATGAVNVTGSIYIRRNPAYLYPLWLGNVVRANLIGVPIVVLGLGITAFGVLRKQSTEKSDKSD